MEDFSSNNREHQRRNKGLDRLSDEQVKNIYDNCYRIFEDLDRAKGLCELLINSGMPKASMEKIKSAIKQAREELDRIRPDSSCL